MSMETGIGRRIRRLREARSLSSKELAALARISPNYLRVLESKASRNPSMAVTQRLAAALKVSVQELISDDEEARRLAELREAKETYDQARAAIERAANIFPFDVWADSIDKMQRDVFDKLKLAVDERQRRQDEEKKGA